MLSASNWVHEMHGQMHPNYWQITILLVVDLCSSLAYFMTTQPLPIASKLPINTLVAKQLPTNVHIIIELFKRPTLTDLHNFFYADNAWPIYQFLITFKIINILQAS